MKLSEYPRPSADNGRGVHWSPSQYQWGRQDWLTWQKRILDMGLKWIKVNVPPDYNAEAIVKRLVEIEVMPVCRYVVKNPAKINASIEKSIERLVKLGARYFETNNEPDADVEWVGYRRPSRWEEMVVRNLIHDANRIQNLGGIPAFVAFNSGPNEPRNPIQILAQTHGGRDVVKRGLWISLHNYGKGRPFNYPNDRVRMFGDAITNVEWTEQNQPDSWNDARLHREVWRGLSREGINQKRIEQKDSNITIMTDITCFRAYEYWHQLLLDEGFDPLPIMMTEGGWETDDGIDDFYPQPTAITASKLNCQMFQFIQGDIDMELYQLDGSTQIRSVPDYLFALMPWHMGERAFGHDTSGQWEQGAWFTHWHDKKYGLNGELPIVQMLHNLSSNVRVDGPVPTEWQTEKQPRPITVKNWDYRLAYLSKPITVEPPQTEGLAWRLIEARWQDKDERNPEQAMPPGYIIVKVRDEQGKPIADAKFEVDRGDAIDPVLTKGEYDQFLGNYRMSATLGTYSVTVTHSNYASDRIYNVGLGAEEPGSEFDQTSFFLVYQLQTAAGTAEDEPNSETILPAPPAIDPDPANDHTDNEVIPPPTSDPVENNAQNLGIRIEPMPAGAACRVKRVHRYQPEERMAANTLYFDVVDRTGKRQYQTTVLLKDAGNNILPVLIEKPEAEPGGNMPMWGGNSYQVVGVIINGVEKSVQPVVNLRSDYPEQGDGHAFLVELQLIEIS